MPLTPCCKQQISLVLFEILSEVEGFKCVGYANVVDEDDEELIKTAKEIENVVKGISDRIKEIAKGLEINPSAIEPIVNYDEIPF